MWTENLKLYYSIFSKKQKKAADYLLEKGMKVGNLTLRQCSKGAQVGQPTILRMLNAAGYESWMEFQKQVWKENGGCEEIEEIQGSKKHLKKYESVIRVVQNDLQMITEMIKQTDLDQLNQIVKIIKKAKIIDVYGTDNSANAAVELSGRLLHLGLTSRNFSDLFFQKISAAHLGKKDVAIGFSMSGETKAVIDALSAAKHNGAVTIAVTGDEISELGKGADYTFITPTIHSSEISRWISSRISQIAFVDMLCAAIMESDRERFSEQLSRSTKEFEKDISERVRN